LAIFLILCYVIVRFKPSRGVEENYKYSQILIKQKINKEELLARVETFYGSKSV